MKFKEIISKHLNEEEWKTRNTKDIEGLKRIQRELMKRYASGNKQFTKDIAIQVAKNIDPHNPVEKKYIKYINNIFEKDNKLTYKEFVNRMIKKGTKKSDIYPITRPEGYENTQVIDRVKNMGANASPVIKEILEKYLDKYPEAVSKIYELMTKRGHFKNTSSFFRYNKPSDKWLHISAIQTDFFNQVRRIGSEEKKAKKMISEILSKEEDVYKTIFSKLVNENSSVKVFTMSSPELAERLETIRSKDKLSKLYKELPRKLGFKRRKLSKDFLEILNNFNKDFITKLYNKYPEANTKFLWFANRHMVNESLKEDGLLVEEEALDDNIKKKLTNLEIAEAIELYIKKNKKDDNSLDKINFSPLFRLIERNSVNEKFIKIFKLEETYPFLRDKKFPYFLKNLLDVLISVRTGKKTIISLHKNLKNLFILCHENFLKFLLKEKKVLERVSASSSNFSDLNKSIELVRENIALKNAFEQRNDKGMETILKDRKTVGDLSIDKVEYRPLIHSILETQIKSKNDFVYFAKMIFLVSDSLSKQKFLNYIERLSENKFNFAEDDKAKIYKILYSAGRNEVNNMHALDFVRQLFDLEIKEFIKKNNISLKTLTNADFFKEMNHGKKLEFLKEIGYPQEVIKKYIPFYAKKTNKEKTFSKKVIGENMFEDLADELQLNEMAKIDISKEVKNDFFDLKVVDGVEKYVDNIIKRAEKRNGDVQNFLDKGMQSLSEGDIINIVSKKFMEETNNKENPYASSDFSKKLLKIVFNSIISHKSYRISEFVGDLPAENVYRITNEKTISFVKKIGKDLSRKGVSIDFFYDFIGTVFKEALETKKVIKNRETERLKKIITNEKRNAKLIRFILNFKAYDKSEKEDAIYFMEVVSSILKKVSRYTLNFLNVQKQTLLGAVSIKEKIKFYELAEKSGAREDLLAFYLEKFLMFNTKEKLSEFLNIKKLPPKQLKKIKFLSNLSDKEKKELLKNGGYSQEEIDKIFVPPNTKKTSKEKSFSKKVIGEGAIKNLLTDLAEKAYSLQEVVKEPTEEETKYHKKKYPNDGTLHYVVKDEDGKKVLTYIDDNYVEKLSKKKGKDITPKQAGYIRLGQIEYFKKKGE